MTLPAPRPAMAAFLDAAVLALVLALVLAPGAARSQGAITQPRLQIYGGNLHHEYLGCLNCDRYDVNSVWNGYGPFGWDNGYIDQSHFSAYFEAHGHFSACDPYAKDPPILIDMSRNSYGRLNISRTRTDSICGPHGAADICAKLLAKCQPAMGGNP